MSDRQESKFDATTCAEMMEKMMAQFGEGWDCSKMMSQMVGQTRAGFCAVPGGMSQMMATCCGEQGETEEETPR